MVNSLIFRAIEEIYADWTYNYLSFRYSKEPMKFVFTFLFLALTSSLLSQTYSVAELEQLEDEVLLEYFVEVSSDSLLGEKVARVYLDRAKREKDTIKMARGYDRLARIFHPEKNIRFADSIIYLTKDLSNITYPGLGYLIKGYHYQKLGILVLATENYLELYNISTENENIVHQLFALDCLIRLKLAWGNKSEALTLQHKRNALLQNKDVIQLIEKTTRKDAKKDVKDYLKIKELRSVLLYVDCYLKLKKNDSAAIYLERGLKLSRDYNGLASRSFYSSFLKASVEVDYYSGDYSNVIKSVNNIFEKDYNIDISYYDFEFNFFKGLSLIEIGDYDLGIKSLKKADSIYDAQDIAIEPHQRVLFNKLLDHSRIEEDDEKHIEYLNKLIYVDSIFKLNYHFFEPNIIKNFETPWLLREKEVLIDGLERRNKTSQYLLIGGLFVVGLILLVLGYIIKKQLQYKRRFLLLLKDNNKASVTQIKKTSDKTEIGAEIIDEILNKLDQFENNDKFLSQSISLQRLATKFKTNTKYLSNVINVEKEKSFPQYINDLRVDYALKEITENSKFIKYTIKAIAGDCGFNSAESFSKAFLKKHKVSPSYYIKKIEKLRRP
jgi:AraC-like DNA-binding protein